MAIHPADRSATELKYGVPLSGPRRRGSASRAAEDRRRRTRKDRDKLLYSDYWRRLAGVTQVVSPEGESAVMHTRLTHSEKVAQVAWSMANHLLADDGMARDIQKWGGLDLDIVETAALAHDMGHPPWGHISEQVLDKFARDIGLPDGFEGNAQSFRAVTNLIKWTKQDARGAAISRGGLAAIVKYPWSRQDTVSFELPGHGGPRVAHDGGAERPRDGALHSSTSRNPAHPALPVSDDPDERPPPKFGYYDSEASLFAEARAWIPAHPGCVSQFSQTLEASIMDLADDVTYAFHDFEDWVLSGAFDVDELLIEAGTYIRSRAKGWWFEDLAEDLQRKYPDDFDEALYADAVDAFYQLLGGAARPEDSGPTREDTSTRVISGLLDSMVPSVHVLSEPPWENGPLVRLGPSQWHVVQVMKAVTLRYIVLDPDIALQQRAQQRIMRELCHEMLRWAVTEPQRLPRPLAERLRHSNVSGPDTALRVAVKTKLIEPYQADVEQVLRRRARPDDAPPERYLVDFIATLSDREARILHRRLTGTDQTFVNGALFH